MSPTLSKNPLEVNRRILWSGALPQAVSNWPLIGGSRRLLLNVGDLEAIRVYQSSGTAAPGADLLAWSWFDNNGFGLTPPVGNNVVQGTGGQMWACANQPTVMIIPVIAQWILFDGANISNQSQATIDIRGCQAGEDLAYASVPLVVSPAALGGGGVANFVPYGSAQHPFSPGTWSLFAGGDFGVNNVVVIIQQTVGIAWTSVAGFSSGNNARWISGRVDLGPAPTRLTIVNDAAGVQNVGGSMTRVYEDRR